MTVKIITERLLKDERFDPAIGPGHPDALAEKSNRGWGVTTAAQSYEGWHPGIIPAIHHPRTHQRLELAFAG